MKTLKIIGNCCLVFLAIICSCVSLAYAYFHFFVKDFTTGTNYIDNQVPVDLVEKIDDLTEEEISSYEDRYLFNVNYYSNDKSNGIEIQEMQLNYFTDNSLEISAVRSTGMQYIGDFENYTVNVETSEEADNYIVPDFYYYDTTNMISWSGGKLATQLNRNTMLTIKIDNKPYLIQLTGQYRTWHYKSLTIIGKWLGMDSYTDTFYDYGSVFYDVMNAVETNSAGYGDYYITVDLSNYFTVYAFDESTNKFIEDNVSDKIFTYAVLKFHYDENGLVNANQSIFGQVECNTNYGIKEDVNTTYWQERMVYNLNNDNLNYRYSDIYNGYFVSLNLETKKLFNSMPRSKVNITINLNDNDKNIIGLDYNAFEDFEIDTLSIIGKNNSFYMLDKALHNSKLQTLKYSNGLILDISTTAINNEYTEVVL